MHIILIQGLAGTSKSINVITIILEDTMVSILI